MRRFVSIPWISLFVIVAAVLLVLLAGAELAQRASATSVADRVKTSIYQGELAFMGLQPPLAGQGNRHSRVESSVGGARGDK